MGKTLSSQRRDWSKVAAASILQLMLILTALLPNSVPLARAQSTSSVGAIKPTTYPLLFGSSGNIEIDIPKPGIAVRIEIPRDFMRVGEGWRAENDTSFVTSNIRNDYYYYNLVDESKHWTYDWRDQASDGACFKPNFSYYDPNAPYCLEIWNYLSSPLNYSAIPPCQPGATEQAGECGYLKQPDYTIRCYTPGPTSYYDLAPPCASVLGYLPFGSITGHFFDYTYLVGVDYCQPPNLDKYVFQCFSATTAAPKFVLLHDLSSPGLAGVYNFTLSVTNRTNILGYPDFVHAWTTNLTVPVSMAYNAGSIIGNICNANSGPPFCNEAIQAKGIVYALQCPATGTCSLQCSSTSTTSKCGLATIVARAYVDASLCPGGVCGSFDLTGLAPGNYLVEGSAGVDVNGVAYSLTPLGYKNAAPTQVLVSANSVTTIGQLPLRPAPLVCASINVYNTVLQPTPALNAHLRAAGFAFSPPPFPPPFPPSPPLEYVPNITVETTDPSGEVFRFQGVFSSPTAISATFSVETGTGVKYVGTDPYGTEYAGLPAPADIGPSGYTMSLNVYVSGFIQQTTESVTITQSPLTPTPSCSPVSPNPVNLIMGGLITGVLQFCNTYQGQCNLESPATAGANLPALEPPTPDDVLFGGNILIEAYDSSGLLRGVTVINGTAADGATNYNDATGGVCLARDSVGNCASIGFYVVGFSEYYNHTQSGVWHTYAPDYGHDYGLPDNQYTLSIYVRGYELTSTSTTISIVGGSISSVTVQMTRGGAFEITVGSYSKRPGTNATIQQQLPWEFLNASIPVAARVYFYGSTGTVGYVDLVMVTGLQDSNLTLVTTNTFTILFAGQNWSLREIYFYGQTPTAITNQTYAIEAYTLGYVPQFEGGITLLNNLVGFAQGLIVMFIANEADITVPLFSNPQSFTTTAENDSAIGRAYSPGLAGAEMTNLPSGTPTLEFRIFGFGGMTFQGVFDVVMNGTVAVPLCVVSPFITLSPIPLCGQGHFFYVDPTGTRYFDFGMGAGNYTMEVPQFGFNFHFLQASTPPTILFTDLYLEAGVVFSMIQMAIIMQGSTSLVQGYCSIGGGQICLNNRPNSFAPLSWAQVQAANSTYSASTSTADGTFDGVDALFVPAGTYDITFSDVQYVSQTWMNIVIGWGTTNSLTPPSYLNPAVGSP